MKRILCWFIGHKWTCKADKGISPNLHEMMTGYLGFRKYAQMFCDRCGKISKLNPTPQDYKKSNS